VSIACQYMPDNFGARTHNLILNDCVQPIAFRIFKNVMKKAKDAPQNVAIVP